MWILRQTRRFVPPCLRALPLAFAFDLDAGAVDQEVERALRAAIGDVDLQGLLATAKGAEVGHRPVQADQPQQALDRSGRLAERTVWALLCQGRTYEPVPMAAG